MRMQYLLLSSLKINYCITNLIFISINSWCLPDKVHAQQCLARCDGLSGPNSLIPNTDSMVIGSHFSPPHPGRLAEDDSMSPLNLRDLDVCALQIGKSEREAVSFTAQSQEYVNGTVCKADNTCNGQEKA